MTSVHQYSYNHGRGIYDVGGLTINFLFFWMCKSKYEKDGEGEQKLSKFNKQLTLPSIDWQVDRSPADVHPESDSIVPTFSRPTDQHWSTDDRMSVDWFDDF